MRVIPGYLLLAGLGAMLSGCAYPAYLAQPAPVYYPLQGGGIYYPAQHAGIYYPSAPPAYPYREHARSSEARPARQPGAEPAQPALRSSGSRSPGGASGWIDPEP